MKHAFLSFMLPLLTIMPLSAQLIISQYYEGDSNDKYLEVTNLGNTTIDLAAEGIRAYLFANDRADDPANNIASIGQALSGTVLPFESLVFCNGLAVQPGYTVGEAVGVNFCGFNGDDLLVLSTAADGLSVIGSAWDNRIDVVGNGTSWGIDVAYVRKNTILEPNVNFSLSEWNAVLLSAVNTAGPEESSYLGTHYSVLPVELIDMKATAFPKFISLTFTTVTEQNNAYFLVQRSGDGGKTFQTIGRIVGQGDSNRPVDYEFIDKQPHAGQSYYRLQQFDFDGSNAFFGPMTANFGGETKVEVTLWPVPAQAYLEVALPTANGNWRLEIFDQSGLRLLQQSGNQQGVDISFDLQGLPAGSYLLQWCNGKRSGRKWFLKV
ncbi:T9SS type A sorting domain-containing protein [Lewinella cohaerens]|uniref:T9SS type A sorting domain-containing protein n=1 Tax=Lewinella cohaerens TaxID=70995 RepID=UPI000376D19B|nr:T9SS type A sorting domain-containing protein [Lewinella cohaerens]